MERVEVKEGENSFTVTRVSVDGEVFPVDSIKGSPTETPLTDGDTIIIRPDLLKPPFVTLYQVELEVKGVLRITMEVTDIDDIVEEKTTVALIRFILIRYYVLFNLPYNGYLYSVML